MLYERTGLGLQFVIALRRQNLSGRENLIESPFTPHGQLRALFPFIHVY
jgi:hypothetical protein